MAQVRISEHADEKLIALSQDRKDKHNLVSSKGGIVEELVLLAHKKECKK